MWDRYYGHKATTLFLEICDGVTFLAYTESVEVIEILDGLPGLAMVASELLISVEPGLNG